MSTLLSDVIEQYLQARKVANKAANTRRNEDLTLRKFLANVGNIQVKRIEVRHIDQHMSKRAVTLAPQSMNIELNNLNQFFNWCRARQIIPPSANPMLGTSLQKYTKKRWQRVPASDFERMLDSARHPVDRLILALGFYLFLRSSEITALKVKDVNLLAGRLNVKVEKTKQLDSMNISLELDRELRRWLTFYAEAKKYTIGEDGKRVELTGQAQPDWFLVPAKNAPIFRQDPKTGKLIMVEAVGSLRPTSSSGYLARVWRRSLDACGYEDVSDDPNYVPSGSHTGRRSGARALYDSLRGLQGHIHAGRLVQRMLHHASFTTTESYLGLDIEDEILDDMFRGKPMFKMPVPQAENVVDLQSRRGLA